MRTSDQTPRVAVIPWPALMGFCSGAVSVSWEVTEAFVPGMLLLDVFRGLSR
jgi:hypothetical protein